MTADLPKIFFSYARADSQFVLELANDLRSAGVNIWIDQQDILPGERWDNAIQKALTTAPCLLVVLSPASVASQSVMDEVAYALQFNKRVVPVLYQRCDIPFRIQRLQYIDFTDSNEEGLRQLLRALKVSLPSQSERTPGVTRSKRGILVIRLTYAIVAGLLVAVIGISYWINKGRQTGEVEITPIGTRQSKVSDEASKAGWSFQVL